MIPVLVIDERRSYEICARPGCNLSAMSDPEIGDRDECKKHWEESCARKRRAKAKAKRLRDAPVPQMPLWSR